MKILLDFTLALIIGTLLSLAEESSSNSRNVVWHRDLGVARIGNAQFMPDYFVDSSNISANLGESLNQANSTSNNFKSLCDFGGQQIRIAVSPQPPLVNCFQNLYGDWMCNGSNIEVIKVLEQRLNFRAEWIVLANNHLDTTLLPSQNEAEEKNKKGKRASDKTKVNTGVLGLVGSGRALMSANGIMKTIDRQRDMLISEPFDSFRLHFLLSKSVRDHDHIFIKPFSPHAWLAIMISALLIVPIFYLINSTSSHYSMQDDKFLSQVSIMKCLRHFLSQDVKKKNKNWFTKQGRSSDSSSLSSLFDQEIDKVVSSSGGALDLEPRVVAKLKSDRLRQRRRRALLRQWDLERKRARRLGRLSRKSGFFKVAYIVWYVVASLANQGGETEDLPRASSTRILIAFWWLYLIVICSIHSGILTAILTFPKQNDFIQTLDDFLAINEGDKMAMKLLVDQQSELAQFLSNADNLHKSSLQVLLAQTPTSTTKKNSINRFEHPIVQVDFQRHRERVLDEVQKGKSAYMEEKSTINLIISQEYFDYKPPKCQFKSSRYPIDIIPMSLVLSNQLPTVCVDYINILLRYIMRTGLAQKWRRKYESQGNDCLNTVIINAGDVNKIELRHVILAFWLLIAGLLFGFLFVVIEVLWMFTEDASYDDNSDSSESSNMINSNNQYSSDESSSDGELRLGHRVASLAERRPIRSLNRNIKLRSINSRPGVGRARVSSLLAAYPLSIEEANLDTPNFIPKEDKETFKQTIDKRQRRRMRASERRARRLKRTVDLVKKLHGGKIYSGFFHKVSDQVRDRARRTSLAFIAANRRLNATRPTDSNRHKPTILGLQSVDGPIRRRRPRATIDGKVAPNS